MCYVVGNVNSWCKIDITNRSRKCVGSDASALRGAEDVCECC